jgi:hypothetical protein
MTDTSGWRRCVAAFQSSGAISAPLTLTSRARSIPRRRQASTAAAATAYAQAATRPHRRCRPLSLKRDTPMANRAHTANAAAHQQRGTLTGASPLASQARRAAMLGPAVSPRTAIKGPPPRRV